MMNRFHLLAGCVLCLNVPFFSMTAFAEMPIRPRAVVAHRGASADAPENTLAAFRLAVAQQADGAECDVYVSLDKHLVLTHDKTTTRTLGGGNRKIVEMTFEELRARDAGLWKGERFKGEKVPTLDEYLAVLQNTTCHPVIEIKTVGFEAAILETVKKRDMLDVSTIIAFSEKAVSEIRRLEPNICVAFLYGERAKENETPEARDARLGVLLLRKSKELDTKVLSLQYTLLTPTLVKTLRDAGIHVWCWTVNEEKDMERMLDWEIESITTDRPAVLRELMKKRQAGR